MSDSMLQFITNQLDKKGIMYRVVNRFAWICCVMHSEDSPSMEVSARYVRCFGCGFRGNWDDVAKRIGAATIFDNLSTDRFDFEIQDALQQVKSYLDDGTAFNQHSRLPAGLTPWKGDWKRGKIRFKNKFLTSLPSYKWNDISRSHKSERVFVTPRILWPIMSHEGEQIGYTARRLDAEKTLKYRNSTKLPVAEALFPIHRTSLDHGFVVLTEGPVDPLRLLQMGIPTLSILGSENYTMRKSAILISSGIKTIVTCMDGDAAGRHAADHVDDISGKDVDVVHVEMPEGTDPGDVSTDWLMMFREFLVKEGIVGRELKTRWKRGVKSY